MLLLGVMSLTFIAGCNGDKKSQDTDVSDTETADTLTTDTIAEEEPADSVENIIAATPMPKAADELFDDFFFNFIANKKLQMERVTFPLPVNNGGQHKQVAEKEWKMDPFFMQQGFYTLIFDNEKQMELVKDTTVDHVVVEKVFLDQKRVEQFIFNREEGLWKMTEINHQPILKDPDDDFSMIEGEFYPEQWEDFKPEILPKDFIYNIQYGTEGKGGAKKIFVIRGISNSLEIEMEFLLKGGEWRLIKLT